MDFKPFIDEAFENSKAIYSNRNSTYKNNWESVGSILNELFPEGVDLKTVNDFARFSLLVQMVGKISRYCINFDVNGHSDSSMDLGVYAMILHAFDNYLEALGTEDSK